MKKLYAFLLASIILFSPCLARATDFGNVNVLGDLTTKKTPMVDVRAFGAVGNGTTDDTAAIKAAATSLPNGGVVFFPAGTWLVSETGATDVAIAVPYANIQFVGVGYASNIKLTTGATAHAFHCSSKNYCAWKNLRISNITSGYGAVYLENSSEATITGNHLEGGNNAIVMNTTCYHNLVDGNLLTSTNSDAVLLLTTCKWNKITNNLIYSAADSAVALVTNCDHNEVNNNIITNSVGAGLYASASYHNKLNGNVIYYPGRAAVALDGSEYNDVQNNNILIPGATGDTQGVILQSSSNNNNISLNTIRGAYGEGIYVLNSNYNILDGNKVLSGRQHGIRLNGADHNTIVGNSCVDNDSQDTSTYDGIHLATSSNNVIVGNTCTTATGTTMQRYGINISNAGCSGTQIGINDLVGNKTGTISDSGTSTVYAASITNNSMVIGATSPNAKAALDLTSTTKGFLPPRMTTTQREAITTPPEGLFIHDINWHYPFYYNGTNWTGIVSGGASISDDVYGANWDTRTTTAPSMNSVYDKIETLAGGHDAVTVGNTTSLNLIINGSQFLNGTVNWTAAIAGVNWQALNAGQLQGAGVNWSSINELIGKTNVNWTDLNRFNATINWPILNWTGSDVVTLSGVAAGSTHLGTFTGSTISDNQTIKAAIQAVETAVETKQATVTEGSLADSTIVSADIKNGEVTAADTAITAGRSLTWSTNDLVADAELYTDTKTIYIEDPTADDDLKTIWVAPLACTITKIHAESDHTVVFDLQVDDGSPAAVNGSDITCTTFATDSSLAGDTSMAAGDRLDLAVTSVADTPTWVSITFEFTYDD